MKRDDILVEKTRYVGWIVKASSPTNKKQRILVLVCSGGMHLFHSVCIVLHHSILSTAYRKAEYNGQHNKLDETAVDNVSVIYCFLKAYMLTDRKIRFDMKL